MQTRTYQRRGLLVALCSGVLWAAGAGAVTLEDARKCLAMHQDAMRLACYDAIFEQLDAESPSAAPPPAEAPPSEPARSVVASPAQNPAQEEPTAQAKPVAKVEDGGFHLPRLWRRDDSGDGSYSAVVVARYPLARKRWILRTDGYELFESYESQDWVPEVGERVTIDPAAVGAGFTVKDARGGARMKRLACDGSSRRKETRRKCELLLDD